MDSMRTKALSELLDMLTSIPVKPGEKPVAGKIEVEMGGSEGGEESGNPMEMSKDKMGMMGKGEEEEEC